MVELLKGHISPSLSNRTSHDQEVFCSNKTGLFPSKSPTRASYLCTDLQSEFLSPFLSIRGKSTRECRIPVIGRKFKIKAEAKIACYYRKYLSCLCEEVLVFLFLFFFFTVMGYLWFMLFLF